MALLHIVGKAFAFCCCCCCSLPTHNFAYLNYIPLNYLKSVEGGLKTGMGRPEGKCKLKWWHGDLSTDLT